MENFQTNTNDTKVDWKSSAQSQVHKWFSQIAGLCKDQVAIAENGTNTTYAELENRSNQLAHYLIAHKKQDHPVVIIMCNSVRNIVISMLAALKSGAIFAILDRDLPDAKLQSQSAQLQAEFLVLDNSLDGPELLPKLEFNGTLISLQQDSFDSEDNWYFPFAQHTEFEASSIEYETHDDAPCYIYFTSGTTAKPKGILGRLRGIAHFIRWELNELQPQQPLRVSQLTNPAFDAFLRDVFVPLCSGGIMCVPHNRNVAHDGVALMDYLNENRIQVLHTVPSIFAQLSAHAETANFPHLDHVFWAGEALLPSIVNPWLQSNNHAALYNLYGPSETTMVKFAYKVEDSHYQKTVPIGQPIKGAAAILLNENLEACADGQVGEVYIRTPYRSLGYFNQPELTAKHFIQNPFSNDKNDLIYKTGDLASVNERGNYEFHGRKDQQIKLGGVRIELSEIENAILQHHQVTQAACIFVKDDGGQLDGHIIAFYVATTPLSQRLLAEHLSQHLSKVMIPSTFIQRDTLSRTLSNKIDRNALKELYSELAIVELPAPTLEDPVEQTLHHIWCRVLDQRSISPQRDFFSLGGNSLRAMTIISQINQHFVLSLHIQTLFDYPTILTLGKHVKSQLENREEVEI